MGDADGKVTGETKQASPALTSLTPRQRAQIEWRNRPGAPNGKGQRIDRARYDLLLASYRLDPGAHSTAAHAAGVTTRTSRLAWESGWKARGFAAIKDVLAEEARLVRTRMAAEALGAGALTVQPHETSPDAVRVEAAERRLALERKREWAELCRGNRSVQARGLALVHRFFDALLTRGDLIERIKTDRTMTPETYMHLVKAGLAAFGALSSAVHSNLQTENLAIGEPTQIIGLQQMASMSWSEAQAEVQAAQESLDRLRASGKLAPGADLPVIEVEVGEPAAPVDAGAAAGGAEAGGSAAACGVGPDDGCDAGEVDAGDGGAPAVPGAEVDGEIAPAASVVGETGNDGELGGNV